MQAAGKFPAMAMPAQTPAGRGWSCGRTVPPPRSANKMRQQDPRTFFVDGNAPIVGVSTLHKMLCRARLHALWCFEMFAWRDGAAGSQMMNCRTRSHAIIDQEARRESSLQYEYMRRPTSSRWCSRVLSASGTLEHVRCTTIYDCISCKSSRHVKWVSLQYMRIWTQGKAAER